MTLVLNGTTGVSSVDGSASTPAIQGTDSNTGVFFPAADTVAIATGGSERLRADSSGNVGIGTSSPLAKLDVNGGIAPTAAPGSNWGLDFAPSTSAGTYLTIANDGTYDLATGSGFVYVWDNNGLGVSQIACYYGSTSIVWQDSTRYTVTVNTASKVNVYYNSGTSKYRIQNKTGSSINIFVSTVRLRAAS